MTRDDKRMLLTMGAVAVATTMVVGFGAVSDTVSATHPGDLRLLCTYEVGHGGDAFASMQEDRTGSFADDPGPYIDQGGCIVSTTGLDMCYVTLARATGGIGDAMGDLTMDFMADGMSLPAKEAQEVNSTLSCAIREVDFSAYSQVQVTVSDDFWGGPNWADISGVLCTDSTDDDSIACEESQLGTPEVRERFCDNTTPRVDFDASTTDHVVVFLDGPANAPLCSNGNPTGATTGGLVEPGYGVIFDFFE